MPPRRLALVLAALDNEPHRRAARIRAMPANETSLAGLKLLLVEDNRDVADLTALSLGAAGAEVSCAYNGSDAIEQGDGNRFDAVIIDLGLPDMDGRAVAERLREVECGARLIALSGFDFASDDRIGTLFDAYLQKPVGAAEIVRVLAESGEKT